MWIIFYIAKISQSTVSQWSRNTWTTSIPHDTFSQPHTHPHTLTHPPHTLLQSGQTRVDLNCPWKWSTKYELFRSRYTLHDSSATSWSGQSSNSTGDVKGLLRTRFKSSCNPSSRYDMNSCESCCWYPPNVLLREAITCLSFTGGKYSYSPDQSFRIMPEKHFASSPLKPRGLVVLMSAK